MAAFRTFDDLNPAGQRVLMRVDLNVPMMNGAVTDATRIERMLPTLRELMAAGAKVGLLSHFGRPKGRVDPSYSLQPIAKALAELLGEPIGFAENCIGSSAANALGEAAPGSVILLENTRFHSGEENNDLQFAQALAENGDIYVNDAFSAAHRAHASTHGLAKILPAYAGRAMEAELQALELALGSPTRPVTALIGGAKISTKLALISHLLEKVDSLVIGGGMANTFLSAQGFSVGRSLGEYDLLETARDILHSANKKSCEIILPMDAVVATALEPNIPTSIVSVESIGADQMILDVGPDSLKAILQLFERSKTLVWNGPLGAFEVPPFDQSTVGAARHAGRLTQKGVLSSVAGGGDTVAALNHANCADEFTYISTAGGAFLEWMEGKTLPGVAVLAS